ncbi:MAG TPA: hypothetical protein VK327_10965, partial [Candidatus Paceibacterota bacterium]|nr:hypothetical protein [Candidatus Paceibacterota bacterium]
FRRRLYRLAHISFFGLAAANFLLFFTMKDLAASGSLAFASGAFLVGAIAMPVCCVVMAHFPKARMLFAIPVVSLTAGAVVALLEVIKL